MTAPVDLDFDAALTEALGAVEFPEDEEYEAPETETEEVEVEDTAEEPEASEEDVDEEEAEEAPAEDDDQDEDDEEAEQEGELHTVVVDGEELQVPTEELVKGYQRREDYTRKTQELSEQRKQLDSDREAVDGFVSQFNDWWAERQADPVGWIGDIVTGTEDPTGVLAQSLVALAREGKLDSEFVKAFGIETGPVADRAKTSFQDKRLTDLEQQRQQQQAQAQAAQQQRELVEQFNSQWADIKAQEALTFDTPDADRTAFVELLRFAREREITHLPTAYAAMAWQRRKAAAPEVQETAKEVVAKKRQTRAMTPTGRTGPKARDFDTVDDALAAAFERVSAAAQ